MLIRRILGLFPFAIAVCASAQDAPLDPIERVKKLDEKLVPALKELAELYDDKKDPEATAFFCECAIGLGAADEKLAALKKKWENELYYGRVRGGATLVDTRPIETRLVKVGEEYRAIVERFLKEWAGKKRADVPDDLLKAIHSAALKSELARGAHEYVQAVQNFNALRAKMKLRALLWDFGQSSRFILGGWYMGETANWGDDGVEKEWLARCKESPAHGDAAEFTKRESNRLPAGQGTAEYLYSLAECAHQLRSNALTREDLLNPDARRLLLGYWREGKHEITRTIKLYRIPREIYRPDIETPSKRYGRDTVVEPRDDWRDVEENLKINARRVVYAHYPYVEEPNAPHAFGDGERMELYWDKEPQYNPGKWGLPIMLRFYTEAKVTDLEYEVREGSKPPRSCRKYLNGDERVDLGPLATILLIPDKRLDFDTAYSVSIKCKVDGAPFSKKWSFTTRSRPKR